MASRRRISRYAIGVISVLIVVIFVARILEPRSYSSQAFIESGVLYDKICTIGSYEMIVCQYTAPPYETFMVLLGLLLVVFIWISGSVTSSSIRADNHPGAEGRRTFVVAASELQDRQSASCCRAWALVDRSVTK
jgi:hypothetical protein